MDVASAVQVRFHWVVVADEFLKVQGVFLVNILDPKVVDNKVERGYWEIFMEIQTRSIPRREVPPVTRTFSSCWLASLPAC